ncbi:hypothetical protein [Staphylococcus xylosus]|uniref:hypothetical protein n=1 Tax=Staphylococcus xylosus TaxID=1288 RepID=UPI000D1D45E1|nr:hypothetical protein [Staphylococcus xylosus]PTH97000.1 hypothetical protein BU099_12345 [Staphylococcus xylosus]
MNTDQLISWVLTTAVPLFIVIATFLGKATKDKNSNENRITKMESKVNNHDREIEYIKVLMDKQREDTKHVSEVLSEVSTKIDTLTNRFDSFENRFYSNQGH